MPTEFFLKATKNPTHSLTVDVLQPALGRLPTCTLDIDYVETEEVSSAFKEINIKVMEVNALETHKQRMISMRIKCRYISDKTRVQ